MITGQPTSGLPDVGCGLGVEGIMSTRHNARVNPLLLSWLSARFGRPPESIETLRPEASFRSFYRIDTPTGPAVVMDAPPAKEDAARFVRLARLMSSHGIPVPIIYQADVSQGFVLMEDLGSTHLIDCYRQNQAADVLHLAVDILQVLQCLPSAELPPYTEDRLNDELTIFSEWFVDKALQTAMPDFWQEFSVELAKTVADQPVVAVHRDYHCKNLLVRDGRLGIVDFQDALAGPALYDLASLLRDCYWVFDESTVQSMLARYLSATTLHFENPLDLLNCTALQRQLKAIGIFARLCLRDGKPSHLDYIDGVLGQSIGLATSCRPNDMISVWLIELRNRWSSCYRRLREAQA